MGLPLPKPVFLVLTRKCQQNLNLCPNRLLLCMRFCIFDSYKTITKCTTLGIIHVYALLPHRTAPHRTAPHRTAPHRNNNFLTVARVPTRGAYIYTEFTYCHSEQREESKNSGHNICFVPQHDEFIHILTHTSNITPFCLLENNR